MVGESMNAAESKMVNSVGMETLIKSASQSKAPQAVDIPHADKPW